MYLQIFEINEISSDFNEITEINGFLSDFKSRTGFWGVSDPFHFLHSLGLLKLKAAGARRFRLAILLTPCSISL